MNTKINISISNPCSQNFSNFDPTKAGGFCNSCQKEVIDFTGMSSQQIISYFKKNNSKKTCGRFTDYQLGTHIELQKKSARYSFWKGIGLTCLSLFSFNILKAQENKNTTEISTQIKSKVAVDTNKKFIIKGIVSDETTPIPGVTVWLEETLHSTETNLEGEFEFPVPLKKGDTLVFNFIGMKTQKIVIENSKNVNIIMKSDHCDILGEVTVKSVYSSKKE